MKRRCLAFLISLTMILPLSSCGKSEKVKLDPKNPVVLTICTYYNDKQLGVMEELIDQYNETEGLKRGIMVETSASGSIPQINKMLIDSANDVAGSITFPDIFIAYKGIIPYIKEKKQVINYRDYFTKDEIDQYLPNLIETGEFEQKGKLSMLPIGGATDITYINKTDFDKIKDKAGIDYSDFETYQKIAKACEKYYKYTDSLTPAPHDGKALYGSDAIMSSVFVILKTKGRPLLDEEMGKPKINLSREDAKILWDLFCVPTYKGYMAKYGKFTSEDIKTGDLLASSSSTAAVMYFPNRIMSPDGEDRDIDIKIMYSPYLEGCEAVSVQQGGGIFITKSTPVREYASAEFVKWLTDKYNNTKFAFKTSYMPVRVDNTSDDFIKQEAQKMGVDEKVIDALMVSSEQTKERKPYTPTNIAQYESVREVVREVFAIEINNKRKEIMERYHDGEDYDKLIQECTSEDSFIKWYNDFYTRLNNAL